MTSLILSSPTVRTSRSRLSVVSCLASLVLPMALGLSSSASAQGYTEISQSIIDENGGFPYQITAPGSYRLTSNLTKNSGVGPAIEILANGVDLDLNNFIIQGPGTCTRNVGSGVVTCSGHVGSAGVQSIAGNAAITIRRGKIFGFIRGIITTSQNVTVEFVTTDQNAFDGVSATGDGTLIHQVSSQRNGANGIVIQNHSAVTNCNATQNDDYGISANLNASIARSYAMGNRLGGMILNPAAVFSLNFVLDNFGADPVLGGQDAGDNNCTNAIGNPTAC